ncbi:MAG: ADP-glyceromanno-heptose 6-epimerase [Planctomycetes bacterium]|nr:ADP-glyceromanno-heptose 6-epimerase [Planctomycetota bacterium]
MIVVTGAAGFIGSAIIAQLNKRNIKDIIAVDQQGEDAKSKNLQNLSFQEFITKDQFLTDVIDQKITTKIDAVFHMGACSSTTETDIAYLTKNNFQYSKHLALWAIDNGIRFIYASSAATYGDGSLGFKDDESQLHLLKPLNPYGQSKQDFDIWARDNQHLDKIAGLKYFNVFGPNEYHKADMRSFVLKAFEQITDTEKVRLFKSYNTKYQDGQQLRDFIYIKDAVDMTLFFADNPSINGIFNIGTANARTWNDLVNAVFGAMNIMPNIEYIGMPDAIKDQYQYFTQADITKIENAGYSKKIRSLENAIKDYVQNYLKTRAYLAGD